MDATWTPGTGCGLSSPIAEAFGVRGEKVTLWMRSERPVSEDTDLRELGKLLEVDMRTWEDNFREAAETRGRTAGLAEGRTELLLNMVRQKFGEESAARMAPVLATRQSEQALNEAGVLLLECETGEDLLAKVCEI